MHEARKPFDHSLGAHLVRLKFGTPEAPRYVGYSVVDVSYPEHKVVLGRGAPGNSTTIDFVSNGGFTAEELRDVAIRLRSGELADLAAVHVDQANELIGAAKAWVGEFNTRFANGRPVQ